MSTETTALRCVGFIMDGNRRWATERGLPLMEGHQAGYRTFQNIVRSLATHHIPHGVFYAFSTENWNRTEHEVSYLLTLFEHMITDLLHKEMHELKIQVRFIGDRSRFSSRLQTLMEEAETRSAGQGETTVWIALSYGGRAEIVAATNSAIANGTPVTEETFGTLLSTYGMPDPDLIIRTSGEQRLSNFLPWQSVYSELIFTKTYWPDFGEEEFQRMLEEYENRTRRKGV